MTRDQAQFQGLGPKVHNGHRIKNKCLDRYTFISLPKSIQAVGNMCSNILLIPEIYLYKI